MPQSGSEGRAKCFDVVIIGAGVVGCAVARRLALDGARVIVLEKASDILDGASKGNSAILHTGFDAPPGSLEQACLAAGYAEYLEIHDSLGLPLIRSGALVIAWTDEQAETLPSLMERARANGVTDVEPLSRGEALAMEPNLSPTLHAAFRVPGEYLIDPWSAPYAYLLQAIENGAELQRSCEVLSGRFDGELWRLETTQEDVCGRWAINAAGLYGDVVDQRLIARSDFQIRPRKGQFVVYDKPAFALASHILLPVPTPITKGVVICRTAFGNLLAGPTAEDQEARDEATLVPEALVGLRTRAEEILPALKDHTVTALYAGLRPATEHKDYCIQANG
ncbi:MAG: NAD(P)/FAD-dependent oxidoreductase, partial [Rhizobiales bacterium]|nr:NAD(P)/FAD-dependent oxidoreductase [Hyphomicrobiales bacterium]